MEIYKSRLIRAKRTVTRKAKGTVRPLAEPSASGRQTMRWLLQDGHTNTFNDPQNLRHKFVLSPHLRDVATHLKSVFATSIA